MGTVPTGRMERELRKYYLRWVSGLSLDEDMQAALAVFKKKSLDIMEEMGGAASRLGVAADFPAPKRLDLALHAGTIYSEMEKAAISASIMTGLNAHDAARAMLRNGTDRGYKQLKRLARTETVRAYWGNQWDEADGLGLVMVWSVERGPRTCQWCIDRDGMVVEDRSIQDHPNGRCTLIPTLPKNVKYKGTVNPDAKSTSAKSPHEATYTDPKWDQAATTSAPGGAAKTIDSTPPATVMSANEANKWGADKMLDVKTLPADMQEQIRLYTGGGYRGTNRSLRQGQFTGSNGAVQKEMVKGLDDAMKLSKTTEDVLVSRATSLEAFPGGDPAAAIGKIISDKGYMSTAVGKQAVGQGFKAAQVEMSITVPTGTPAIWTRPVSQFKTERELLLDRNAKLKVTEAVYNPRKAKWEVKAEVVLEKGAVKPVPVAKAAKPVKPGEAVWAKKKTPKYVVDDLGEQTVKNIDKIDDAMNTLSQYTNEGAFEPLNAHLRGVARSSEGTALDNFFTGDLDLGWVKQYTKDLDDIIAQQRTLSEMTLYRGVAPGGIGDVKRGTVLTDKGYVSSTTDVAIAQDFSAGGTVMKITYPAGRPALYVDALEDINLGQSEVLLPRGIQFSVTNVTEVDGVRVISVRAN